MKHIGQSDFSEIQIADDGLMDRTHMRWVTGSSIIKLFEDNGFKIVEGMQCIFEESEQAHFLPAIAEMGKWPVPQRYGIKDSL